MKTAMKNTAPDLSAIDSSKVNLLKVSFELKKRVAAPAHMNMEVGEYLGRFYLLDFTTNRISRLTLGAFMHLSEAWKHDRQLAGMLG